MSSHHRTNDGHRESNLYRFSVIREENHCRWRLPLWLLLFGGMVSVLTLSYLLTGTVYPNSWTGVLTAAEGFYRTGHQPPPTMITAAASSSGGSMLEPVSHAAPERVFARISRSGDITMMAPRSIGRPSSCGPATVVDNTVSLLVQVRMPHDAPRGARCAVTSGITLARRLEAAGKGARVQMWSLDQTTTPDANTWVSRPQREAHVSSFDVRPGGLLLHSAEFGCPPPSQSLQTFEISCAGGDDDDDDGACSVDVWQDLFRVEIRA